MSERRFPVLGGPSVPWHLVEPHEAQAQKNHSQSLERLAERGGLSPQELFCVVYSKAWQVQEDYDYDRWIRNWLEIHEGYQAQRDAAHAKMRVLQQQLEDAKAADRLATRLLEGADKRIEGLKVDISKLTTRQQELLATIRKLSSEIPYAEEASNAATLIAEVGTLRARVAELERERDAR